MHPLVLALAMPHPHIGPSDALLRAQHVWASSRQRVWNMLHGMVKSYTPLPAGQIGSQELSVLHLQLSQQIGIYLQQAPGVSITNNRKAGGR